MIRTTHGQLDDKFLERTMGLIDGPKDFQIWVEWRLTGHHEPCAICDAPQENPITVRKDGVVLVRRDAHVILKEPSVVAEAVAAEMV